jgi:hypothetical protein
VFIRQVTYGRQAPTKFPFGRKIKENVEKKGVGELGELLAEPSFARPGGVKSNYGVDIDEK